MEWVERPRKLNKEVDQKEKAKEWKNSKKVKDKSSESRKETNFNFGEFKLNSHLFQ